jgi:hypothetical protein
MKMAVFWVVVLCRLVRVSRFRGPKCRHPKSEGPDDGGRIDL